jgi:hypothetical protein
MFKFACSLAGVALFAALPLTAHGQQDQTLQNQNEFQAPPNTLSFDETGTLEGMQGNLLKFRDSKNDVWLLQVNPQTVVNIAGEADFSYLRPGQIVELTATINEDATIEEPIKELEVLNAKRVTTGLFDVADYGPGSKPVRDPAAGEYRVRGRIVVAKNKELTIAAGRLKISGNAADDFKAILKVDDPSLAQTGDEMKVKAWYIESSRPVTALTKFGQAIAESVDITLANPPATKRGR